MNTWGRLSAAPFLSVLYKQLLNPLLAMSPEEFEEHARSVSGDPNWSLDDPKYAIQSMEEEAKSFPPVDDFISYVKNIDWDDVRERARKGVNNCGLIIAVTGEKIHDIGAWLAQV